MWLLMTSQQIRGGTMARARLPVLLPNYRWSITWQGKCTRSAGSADPSSLCFSLPVRWRTISNGERGEVHGARDAASGPVVAGTPVVGPARGEVGDRTGTCPAHRKSGGAWRTRGVQERYVIQDLRAKHATHKAQMGLSAQLALGHTDPRTTACYVRSPAGRVVVTLKTPEDSQK